MKKLNLGCGRDILDGYINLDFIEGKGVDVVHDLNEFPYPFEDDYFGEIEAISIIEHLDKTQKAIEELHRISKPGAKIKIIVPHYSSVSAWTDITHARTFGLKSFVHYNIDSKCSTSLLNRDTKIMFKIKTIPMMFWGWRMFGLKELAKRFPSFYENFLTYIFQIGAIKWKMIVIK